MTAPAEKTRMAAYGALSATLWCRIFAGWQLRLTRPGDLALTAPFAGPRKRSAAGQGQRVRSRFCAGWRLRLTRPTVRATCR
ncbi:hypothetical protein M3O75_12515 [Klebsiella pneumoniae]|nr:hypothetical protein [Klebsiella pneumoniae]